MKVRILAATLLLLASPIMLLAQSPEKPKTGLNVGDVAPEITGKSVEGKAMKLSDYRGKVVVLDFFGDW